LVLTKVFQLRHESVLQHVQKSVLINWTIQEMQSEPSFTNHWAVPPRLGWRPSLCGSIRSRMFLLVLSTSRLSLDDWLAKGVKGRGRRPYEVSYGAHSWGSTPLYWYSWWWLRLTGRLASRGRYVCLTPSLWLSGRRVRP